MKRNFFRLLDQYREMAPRDFLLSLNFEESEAVELCRDLSLDCDGRRPHFGTSAAYIAIVTSQRFAEIYERVRLGQKTAFLRYLDGFGVDYRKEGLTIVDVGWRGSIQDNIYFALDGEVALSGYYLGLLQPTHMGPKNRKTGILFEDCPVETPFLEVYNSNRSFFEMLLDASHGSAERYETGDRKTGDTEIPPATEKTGKAPAERCRSEPPTFPRSGICSLPIFNRSRRASATCAGASITSRPSRAVRCRTTNGSPGATPA